MIFTSYFGMVKNLPKNVVPIAICINPPVGYKGRWYPDLAPDYDILRRWKRDGDSEWFHKAYTRSVLDKRTVYGVLNDIEDMLPMEFATNLTTSIEKSPNYHVALICYEKPDSFCHRHLVAGWFKRNGIECKEWAYQINRDKQ